MILVEILKWQYLYLDAFYMLPGVTDHAIWLPLINLWVVVYGDDVNIVDENINTIK